MERKKRSKGSVWEFCYANKIFGTYGFEIRACGQKLVKFCAHTHTTSAKLVVRILGWGPALYQYTLHRCASAPAETQIVEMEPKNRCFQLITKNILHFFPRGDLQMTKMLVSKMTESLYEWRRVDMHATPLPPPPYFKHATWLYQIYWTPPFLKTWIRPCIMMVMRTSSSSPLLGGPHAGSVCSHSDGPACELPLLPRC